MGCGLCLLSSFGPMEEWVTDGNLAASGCGLGLLSSFGPVEEWVTNGKLVAAGCGASLPHCSRIVCLKFAIWSTTTSLLLQGMALVKQLLTDLDYLNAVCWHTWLPHSSIQRPLYPGEPQEYKESLSTLGASE